MTMTVRNYWSGRTIDRCLVHCPACDPGVTIWKSRSGASCGHYFTTDIITLSDVGCWTTTPLAVLLFGLFLRSSWAGYLYTKGLVHTSTTWRATSLSIQNMGPTHGPLDRCIDIVGACLSVLDTSRSGRRWGKVAYLVLFAQ